MELLIGHDGGGGLRRSCSGYPFHLLRELLARDGASWEMVERLISAGDLIELEYRGHRFYLRRLPTTYGR